MTKNLLVSCLAIGVVGCSGGAGEPEPEPTTDETTETAPLIKPDPGVRPQDAICGDGQNLHCTTGSNTQKIVCTCRPAR